MTIFLQPRPLKVNPILPAAKSGDNYVSGGKEPENEGSSNDEEVPSADTVETDEEQHDAGQGDLHPSNEVWR